MIEAFNFGESLAQARKIYPMPRLMAYYGLVPTGIEREKFDCPYCKKKGATFWYGSNEPLFKCWHATCPSGTNVPGSAWDQIRFLQQHLNVSRKDACIELMKLAGTWRELERGNKKKKPDEKPRGSAALPSDKPQPTTSKEISSAGEPADARTEDTSTASSEPQTIGPAREISSDPGVADGSTDQGKARPNDPAASPAGDFPPRPEETSTKTTGEAAQSSSDEKPRGSAALPPANESKADKPKEPPSADIIQLFGGPPTGSGGGGDGDDGGGDDLPPPGEGSPAMQALRWFCAKIILTDADREKLWIDRGLTAKTCARAGFKSARMENEPILLAMKLEEGQAPEPGKYPLPVLIDSGLWTRNVDKSQPAKPNLQYCGWGLKTRGGRDEKGNKLADVWDWTQPILIPYFNSRGEVIFLRPHKGGPSGMGNRFFMARDAKETHGTTWVGGRHDGASRDEADCAIISESEFKAWAIRQVMDDPEWIQRGHDRIAVGAVPGIQSSKPLLGDIEDWLEIVFERGANARPVLVGFDNEEKGDPKLPGYKADENDRYEAQIWARWLVRQVNSQGYQGKVCMLPEAWRDATGKADWDGALAMLVKQERDARKPATPGPVNLSNAIWEEIKGPIRHRFAEVFAKAAPVADMDGFFDARAERIIQNGVIRISFTPDVPYGGRTEEITAGRLHRYARKMRQDPRFQNDKEAHKRVGFLWLLAQRYQALKDRYYEFKDLTDQHKEKWQQWLGTLGEEDAELRRACEIALKGMPTPISNFHVKWHYEIIRPDGKRDRLVTIQNVDGQQTKVIALPSESFASPTYWREWLLNAGGYAWRTGERALQALHEDAAHLLKRLEIESVPVRGWYPPARAWFFGDAAYESDGREIWPDKRGIFWVNGQGYKLWDKDQEGQTFRQGTPLMHPTKACPKCHGKEGGQCDRCQGRGRISNDYKREGMNEAQSLQTLWREMCQSMHDTLGGADGELVLGVALSCFALPEIFREFRGSPGLWLHGEKGHGKNFLGQKLMMLLGFPDPIGTMLPESTAAGVGILFQQYSNLLAWVDEYQPSAAGWVEGKLKNAYDRGGSSKKTFDDKPRDIVGPVMVTGIATSDESQLRQRYAHVLVSKQKRLRETKDWFLEHERDFFFISRYILRNRRVFADETMNILRRWSGSDKAKKLAERTALVYGAGYSAFAAMANLMESHDAQAMRQVSAHVFNVCAEQERITEGRVDVNQFWTTLIAAMENKELGYSDSDLTQIFIVRENPEPDLPLPEFQQNYAREEPFTKWRHYRLYFRPAAVINLLREYSRKLGITKQLQQSDIQAQMRTKAYWVSPGRWGEHKQRFGIGWRNKQAKGCWCIDVDHHEMGYQDVTEEEWRQSFLTIKDGREMNLERAGWVDPRKGDLFALIDLILAKETEATETTQ